MIFYSALKIIECSISADDCFYLKDTNNNYVNISSSGVKLSGDKCVLKAEKHSLGGYTFTSSNQSMNNKDNKTNTTAKDTDSATTNMKITKEGNYVKITYDSNSCATVDGTSMIFTDCEKNNKKQQFTVEKVDCEESADSSKDSSKTSASDNSKTSTNSSKDNSKTTTTGKDSTKSADSTSSKSASANNSNSSNPKTDNIEPNKSTSSSAGNSGNSSNSSKTTPSDKDKRSSAENNSNSSKSDKDSNNSSSVPKSATVNYSTADSKNTKSNSKTKTKTKTSAEDSSDESSTTSAPTSTSYTVKQNKNVSVKTTDIIYPSSKSATPTNSNIGSYQQKI